MITKKKILLWLCLWFLVSFGLPLRANAVSLDKQPKSKNETTVISRQAKNLGRSNVTFNLYGKASTSGSEIIMTTLGKQQSAAIWLKGKVNLGHDFTITAEMNFGQATIPADGMTFAIQNEYPNFLGVPGQGLGLYGYGTTTKSRLTRALAVEMDTYLDNGPNSPGASGTRDNLTDTPIAYGDQGSGHIAWLNADHFDFNRFQNQGRVAHQGVVHFPRNNPIANNNWRKFTATWHAQTKKLSYNLDGIGGTADGSSLNQGDNYIGFTAGTGEYYTIQKIRNVNLSNGTPPAPVADGKVRIEYRNYVTQAEIAPRFEKSGKDGVRETFSPIAIAGYQYYQANPANATVIYKQGQMQTIIFYYQPVTVPPPVPQEGQVVIEYRNYLNNEKIATSLTYSGKVGTKETFSPLAIRDYDYFSVVPTDASVTYKTGPAQTIIFYYTPKIKPNPPLEKGWLKVEYRDAYTGNILRPTLTKEGIAGVKETVVPPVISGYDYLLSNPTPAEVIYQSGVTQTIVLYYIEKQKPPEPVKKGTITVEYRHYLTNKQIILPMVHTDNDGVTKTFPLLEIPEYDFVMVNPSNATETFEYNKNKTVIFYYIEKNKPIKEGEVVVEYLEKDTNQAIATALHKTNTAGVQETFFPIMVPGYEYLFSTPSNPTITYLEGQKLTIRFYYQKKVVPPIESKIKLEYRERTTNQEIQTSTVYNGYQGEKVNIYPTWIKGYISEGIEPSADEGTNTYIYTAKERTLIAYYKRAEEPKPDTGRIVVKYVDIEAPSVVLAQETIEQPVATPYTASVKELAGYVFVEANPVNRTVIIEQVGQTKTITLFYQARKLLLKSVPTLNFGKHAVSSRKQEFSISEQQQALIVQDFRDKNPWWNVTLRLSKPFTSMQSKHVLANILYYRSGGTVSLVPDNKSLKIYQKQTENSQAVVISDGWQAGKEGPFLKLTGQAMAAEEYQAEFTWSLNDVP